MLNYGVNSYKIRHSANSLTCWTKKERMIQLNNQEIEIKEAKDGQMSE